MGPSVPARRGETPSAGYVSLDYSSTWLPSDAHGLTVTSWCWAEGIE